MHEDEVAEVHIGLPSGQGLLPHLSKTQHCLQARSIALLQRGESQLAGVADEDHPSNDAHKVLGLLASL